ncbi:hypothetical protein VNO77_44635 [Canavalia gladiata]|uniref:TIR domain-containing protein n=1 Tax=Canavalia gladiata TaxID=3824 RepID=A0AAN9JXD7_CANGL
MAKQQIFRAVASSSNSYSMESSKAYDVFLSFQGEDTRRNFTSHLYEALIQKKVETFRDSEELKKGNEISPSLIKAIKNSHVSVVIFSENYASSKWCLAELTKILECKKEQGQVVIPVFYNIDPSHVRKQTKSYKQAFAKHEQDTKCNKDELQIWKAALIEAANLAGWDSQTYRTEPEFIKDIVTDILQKLNLKYPTELKGLVGIEGNYAQLESLLEIGSREVRMIGIWGMGGIDPGRRSRLWRHEEVCDVLKHNRGTDAVEGITLDLSKLTEDLYLRSDSFSEMTKMRLLNIIHGNYLTNRTFMVYLPNGLDSLSDELRYLCWENFCLESLPSNFCAKHLVELHMRNSNLKKLWDGVQNLVNLNAVDLSNSKNLVAVPDLSRATNLEKVDLKHCYNLQVLPYKFDQLLSLTYLNLSRTNIEMLPANIKNLSKLKWLMLEDCKKLLSLPELPPSLEKLDASNCISLDTNSTQQMVVEHMLRRSIYHDFMDSYCDCFWFPEEHVLNNFQFHEGRSSITIPYLHKSDMRGFIYYYIFKGGIGDILVDYIYDAFFRCKESGYMFSCPVVFKDFISKHVLFFYEDISNMKKVNEAYDHCCNRTIDFHLVECMKGYDYAHRVVKGCGAIPVYASELGLDMLGGSSKNCF